MGGNSRSLTSEAHLSAEQSSTQATPRISQAHVFGRRSRGACAPALETTQTSIRLGSMTAGVTRLRQRADFLRIAGSGRKKVTPGFVLQADRTPTSTVTEQESVAMRVGYTVTRKVGNAVVRNKAKRRLRAVARDVLGDHGRPGFDYVLIGRRTTNTRPYGNLVADLRSALSQVHADNRLTTVIG